MRFSAPPASDYEEYARLPDRAKEELQQLLSALEIVHAAPTIKAGCEAAAARLLGIRGMSAANLKRRYLTYKASGGDWHTLVKKTLLGKTLVKRHTLPEAFIQHWQRLGESNARKWKPAYRALLRSWRSGASIPGYGTWQEWYLREHPTRCLPRLCPEDIPAGWSYENLMLHKSPEAEVTAARRGIAAAMEHLPTLSIETSQLQPLQVVIFDDVRTDFLIHVPEVNQVCELWGLVAMDLATRSILRFALRPRIKRDDGTKESILRRDMQVLVTNLLREHGYPKGDHGMTLVVENASAAITPPFQDALRQTTEGQVRVQRTSMITGQLFMEGFVDGNRGNYKGKAWLESYFNLLHNELASLPGQTGASYQLKPAELEGRRKEAMKLLEKGASLPPALRLQLRLPFLTLQEAIVAMEDTFRRIDSRTDHRLKGFDQVTEWRLPETHGGTLSEEWQPWANLPALPAELVPTIATRTRPETPMERWAAHYRPENYVRLPQAALPALLMDHKQITYQTPKTFGFRLDKKQHAFWSPGLEDQLQPGQQYLAWFDSQALAEIHLTDKQGRYIGTVPRRHGVAWGDREELARQIAEKKRTLNNTCDRVRTRHFTEEAAHRRIEDITHNTRLLEHAAQPEEEAPATTGQRIAKATKNPKRQQDPIDVAAEILKKEQHRKPSTTTAPIAEETESEWAEF